jgi:hypothetical protein
MRTTTDSVPDVSSRGWDAPALIFSLDSRDLKACVIAAAVVLAGCLFFIFAVVDCAFRLAVAR